MVLAPGSIEGEAEEHPPEPVGTSVREEGEVTIYEAVLPGELVDWAISESAASRALSDDATGVGRRVQTGDSMVFWREKAHWRR